MATKTKVEPLTGDALLAKVKELETHSKEEKARECGYYTVTKNGVERVNMMKFYNALIEAEGVELDSNRSVLLADHPADGNYVVSFEYSTNIILAWSLKSLLQHKSARL